MRCVSAFSLLRSTWTDSGLWTTNSTVASGNSYVCLIFAVASISWTGLTSYVLCLALHRRPSVLLRVRQSTFPPFQSSFNSRFDLTFLAFLRCL